MTEATSLRIAKLNSTNYQTWKFKLELLLIKEDVWQVVSEDAPDTITQAWRTKDCKARATIGLLLEDSQLHLVRKETTARGMWQALKLYHEKSTLSNKVSLLRKLCALKLTETGNMEDHLAHMEDLIDQLSSLGETLAEQLTVALFLSSLPESYSTLITALETRPEADLTVHLVKNKLIEEFKRRNESSAATSYRLDQDLQALKITQSGTRHTNSKQTSLVCFFCKKPNHLKKECRKYLEWKKKHPDHKAKAVQQYDEEVSDYESDQQCCFRAGESNSRDVWYIDSGASSHMCSNRNFFTELNDQQTGQVILADGQKLSTLGIGNGYLNCITDSEQREIKFTDILYVPQLKGNLLSVRKLTEKQLKVVFEGESCLIMMNNKLLAHASLKHRLYELNSSDFALMSTMDTDCIHVWHNRLGHRDPKAIQLLEQQLESFQIKQCQTRQICECCIQAKLTTKPLPKKSETRTNAVLDIVHTDVCGPMQTLTLDIVHTDVCGPMQTLTPSGRKYFMTMIDDFSKYTIIYLLKNKSEVPDKIKEYVKLVQTKFNKTPKVIRSDRGGEYVNETLTQFFKNEGITPQFTVPYTPQQNGVAERKNRYLTEMTRAMLIDSKLPNKYWGEAVNTANYLQNILPASSEAVTPYGRWEGVQPCLTHIKQFGCQTYSVTPAHKRQKLDCKAVKLTFVGYADGKKGYRLLDTATNKIYISRYVKFIEVDPHQLASTTG
jgi:transposase InsO family protein